MFAALMKLEVVLPWLQLWQNSSNTTCLTNRSKLKEGWSKQMLVLSFSTGVAKLGETSHTLSGHSTV